MKMQILQQKNSEIKKNQIEIKNKKWDFGYIADEQNLNKSFAIIKLVLKQNISKQ